MATADDELLNSEEEDMMIDGGDLPHTPTQQTPHRDPAAALSCHYYSPHVLQVSMAEYNHQITETTQEAVKSLKSSPEFKMHVQKCHR